MHDCALVQYGVQYVYRFKQLDLHRWWYWCSTEYEYTDGGTRAVLSTSIQMVVLVQY